MRVGLVTLAVWSALSLATAATVQSATTAPALSAPLQAKLVVCAACHGATGMATLAGVPHLAGQPRLFIENRLVMMREGLSVVPQMAGLLDKLSDADLTALSQHYAVMPLVVAAASSPSPNAHPDAQRVARGQALSQRALCGSCHLPSYAGREQIPRLAGQREDYLLHSLRMFASGQTAGRDTLMSSALHGLVDADLVDLAHYLAHAKTAPATR
jgi:cytochrome c553